MTVLAVLALRALGLGDLLTAVPALRGLRAAYPEHRIVLAAPAPLRDIVALTGAVDELLPTASLGPIGWTGLPPAVAVNLHGRGPQSTDALRALAPERLITHGPSVPWDPDAHEVHRWCRLLHAAGIAADPADLGLLVPREPSPAPGVAVVHPGAAFASRRWPPERFAAVARRLMAAGVPVVVTGSAAERDLAASVATGAGLASDSGLAGRTGLTSLAALVAGASLVVCGDTGIAHLATAYGAPSVVLFGPVTPRLWGPPRERAQHVTLWAGQTGEPFADRPAPGLLRISVDDVTAAAEGLLNQPVPRTAAVPCAAVPRRPRRNPRTARR